MMVPLEQCRQKFAVQPWVVFAPEGFIYTTASSRHMIKALEMTHSTRMEEFDSNISRADTSLQRVLHADDDPDILELAHLALDELGGLDVVQLSSSADVIETALRFNPQLILLDVMMPDLSGEQLIANIESTGQLASVPIVFMTAKGNQMAKERLLSLGAADVIVKPFDPTALADRLREIYKKTLKASEEL